MGQIINVGARGPQCTIYRVTSYLRLGLVYNNLQPKYELPRSTASDNSGIWKNCSWGTVLLSYH